MSNYKLSDICKIRYGKDHKSLDNGNIPVYGTGGIMRYVDSTLYEKESVLIPRKGTLSNLFYVDEPFWTIDTLFYTEIDKSKVLPKYLYFKLKTIDLAGMNVGTAVPSLTTALLNEIELNIPSLENQIKIVDILSSLENKIENNNAIIANLEEQAQTIFKSWFIDFEPFQDEEFVGTELGEIPKRFKLGTMNDLISEVTSGDWGKKEPTGNYIEEVYCIRGADIPKVNIGEMGSPAKRFINKKNIEKKTLNPYDITIEISGGSPTQSTGRSTIINKNIINKFDNPIVCTNFCKKISSHSKYEAVFLYSYLQYLYGNDVLFMYENGTTGIKNLDYKVLFNKHEIAIPPISKLKEYFSIFDNIWTYLQHLGILNAKLAEIRDMLLPKLMSGEIRVEEAIEVE